VTGTIVEQDSQKANRLQIELTKLLTDIDQQSAQLDKDFVRLGVMLQDVRENKLWEPLGYGGYNAFIKSLSEKFQSASRTKLYATAQIAEQLLDVATPQDIEQMGMSKASKLASAMKKADGKKPTDALLQQAKDPKVTIQQFDAKIADEYQFHNEFESGSWIDLAGCYMTAEEKAEWERAIKTACLDDPPLPMLDKWNDNSASHIRKEILWRWTASYLADKEPSIVKKQSDVRDKSNNEAANTNNQDEGWGL
jgi:hypothetical protein